MRSLPSEGKHTKKIESANHMFKRILIANRGEIAVRIIRTCRDLHLASVAIYTQVDRQGLWVRLADEALELKGFRGREGYLNIEAVLQLAEQANIEAIHPGYGFLSEDPAFAKACREHGFIFIGPSEDAMKLSGNKTKAREVASSLGIPVLPGSEPLNNPGQAQKKAAQLGYPVLLKAAAGGGGRGMRIITTPDEMKPMFESAAREALASFKDSTLYLEKYLTNPRHLEVQILADQFGNAVHLGERECSIQRRHQKLIEESPSPIADQKLRESLAEAALGFVKQTGYTNAGTVEFLVDEKHNYYFLEMNARLQVEHPVTELVTGIDLVEAQINIAQGKPLPWNQHEILPNGSAVEVRINCEDPERDFLPSPGEIKSLEFPAGPWVRVDSALFPGYQIPEEFDSLIAKVICWGSNRKQALSRMTRALGEFRISGIPTTLTLHTQILNHPHFKEGKISTHFLQEHAEGLSSKITGMEKKIAALIAVLQTQSGLVSPSSEQIGNRWAQAGRLENIST